MTRGWESLSCADLLRAARAVEQIALGIYHTDVRSVGDTALKTDAEPELDLPRI